MKKRISHAKSRKGCLNCKKRHVKCDEQGPPCANCIAREIANSCNYKTSPPAQTQDAASTSEVVSTTSSRGESQKSSPTAIVKDTSETCRLLELELMHRWSVETYKSLCSVPEDHHYLQIEVPRGALRYDFLLNGIFAITALEIAACDKNVDASKYVCTAMEYYDKASESFRVALCNVTPENQHFLYIFAVAATVINVAMPQDLPGEDCQDSSMLKRMIILFELFIGASSIAAMNWNWMFDSPFSPSLLSALSLMQKAPPEPISETTKQAFEYLTAIIDSVSNDEDSDSRASYKKAADSLHYCFREEDKGLIRGFCVAFPVLVGQEFTTAFKNLVPMALFIVMYWGVLIHKQDEVWWSYMVGKNLVLEITDALLESPPDISAMTEWNAGIAWARKEVGLESSWGLARS